MRLIGRDGTQIRDLMASLKAGKSSKCCRRFGGYGRRWQDGAGSRISRAIGRERLISPRPGGLDLSGGADQRGNGLAEVWTRIGGKLGLQQLATLTEAGGAAGGRCAEDWRAERLTLLALDNVERDLDAQCAA